MTETLQPAPYVTIKTASMITGLSVNSINSNIDQGRWIEGDQYRIGPDGRRYVRMAGFIQWVERGRSGQKRGRNSRKAEVNTDRVFMDGETATPAIAC